MWLYLVASARAAAPLLTCDYGDDISDIVGLAGREGTPTVTIYVAEDCDVSADAVFFAPSGYGTSEYIVVPDTGAGTRVFPPFAVAAGATVRMERMVIDRTSAALEIPDVTTGGIEMGGRAAAYVLGATLEVTDVTLTGADGAGLVLVDGDLQGEGLEATGFSTRRPLYAIARDARTTVRLTDATIEANPAGGVALWGEGADVEAVLTAPTFTDNGPADGADLFSLNVASLSVTDGTFTGTDAGDGVIPNGAAPVYVYGGSLACTNCTFRDTQGATASTIAAFLQSGDELRLTGGEIAPLSSSDTVMHVDTDGTFSTYTTRFVGAGMLRRYGGDTTLTSTQFLGEGANVASSAIKLSMTTATLDGVTLCGYAGASFGLVAAYASTVTLKDSVLHGLSLAGAPVLYAWDTAGPTEVTAHDNTLAGSDAALVGGDPAELTFYNNLVTEATAGIQVGALPGGATVAYNLFHAVDTPLSDGTPDATNLIGADPWLSEGFTAGSCDTAPWLREGSPANAAGDPAFGDIYGNPRSDIGALDFDEAGVPPDTGDPGDTGPGDTGTPDTAGPGDTAGEPALVGGALPPCGCGDDTGAAALLGLLPLLLRRRRA